ncbi:MAG: pyridoxal 5'-phosphate synthase glutaminase subunit PdxT [Acidimicrobiia bacterium]
MGVLALQGAFAAHVGALGDLGCDAREVRLPDDLVGLDGLILPGGESTTMSNLLRSSGLHEPIVEFVRHGRAVFGTCAGMILLADEILDGRADQIALGGLDITVRRNGYGRQVDSFETDLDVTSFDHPFHAVFIRAPLIERRGATVEVLAEHDGRAVLVRESNVLASSFHPELTRDGRVHAIFVNMVEECASSARTQ